MRCFKAAAVVCLLLVTAPWPWADVFTDEDDFGVELPSSARFGAALDEDAGWLVVGAPSYWIDGERESGAVYLKRGDEEPLLLLGEDTGSFDRFGTAVAISGTTLVVGAPTKGLGATYVFELQGDVWRQTSRLAPPSFPSARDFGEVVATDGETIVVGVPKSRLALVFVRNPDGWSWAQTLRAPDFDADSFGDDVEVVGNRILVSDMEDDEGDVNAGAIHIYRGSGSNWQYEQKLFSPDFVRFGRFGRSEFLGGDLYVAEVSPPLIHHYREVAGAYEFVATLQHRLTDPAARSWAFEVGPTTLALSVDSAVAIFRRDGDSWRSAEIVRSRYDRAGLSFGWSVALYDDSLAVGASNSGRGRVFTYRNGDNRPPLAFAGSDEVLECSSTRGALLTLDGSASFDEDEQLGEGDRIATHEWFEFFGSPEEVDLGTSPIEEFEYDLGDYAFTLRVTDTRGASETAVTRKGVVDTTPPSGGIVDPLPGACVGADFELSEDFMDVCDVAPVVALALASDNPLEPLGATGPSLFGQAMARDGDRLVVGAPGDDGRGAAYVFRREDGIWSQEQKLARSDGASREFAGLAVAVSGDTVLVGAPFADRYGVDSGAVYAWTAGPEGWSESLVEVPGIKARDLFGSSLAMRGDLLFVGSRRRDDPSGVVYVLRRSGGDWVIEQELTPSQTTEFASFGNDLVFDGETLLVAAPAEGETGQLWGAAYFFEYDGEQWVETSRVLASDPRNNAGLGDGMAIEGDWAVIGATGVNGFPRGVGAAYVFRRNADGTWTEDQRLDPGMDFSVFGAQFGRSVTLSDGLLVIGAHRYSPPRSNGAAFVYRREGGRWVIQHRFEPSPFLFSAQLGLASVVDDGRLIVSSSGGGSQALGALHFFDLAPGADRLPHGETRLIASAHDRSGNLTQEERTFTVDRVPPQLEWIDFAWDRVFPLAVPFREVFRSDDEDGVAGEVIREELTLFGCLTFDGATLGNRDGLLTDEQLVLNRDSVCAALESCVPTSTLLAVAEDCGGNESRIEEELPFDPQQILATCGFTAE